jgi:hypothetical protein
METRNERRVYVRIIAKGQLGYAECRTEHYFIFRITWHWILFNTFHEFTHAKMLPMPVTVAVRSKACTVFARSEERIVGSNPTQGMDV